MSRFQRPHLTWPSTSLTALHQVLQRQQLRVITLYIYISSPRLHISSNKLHTLYQHGLPAPDVKTCHTAEEHKEHVAQRRPSIPMPSHGSHGPTIVSHRPTHSTQTPSSLTMNSIWYFTILLVSQHALRMLSILNHILPHENFQICKFEQIAYWRWSLNWSTTAESKIWSCRGFQVQWSVTEAGCSMIAGLQSRLSLFLCR